MKCVAPTLRFLFILSVSLLTFLITISLIYFISKQYKEEAMDHLAHYTETIAQDLALATTDYIITENFSSLQDFVLSYHNRPHIDAISIINISGVVIAASQPELLGQFVDVVQAGKLDSGYPEFDFKTWTMQYLLPVRLAGTTVSWCQVTVNTEQLKNGLAVLQQRAIFFGIVCWLLACVIAIFISSVITRLITGIITVAQDVSSGNFSRQADMKGPQEICQLAIAFNAMTDAIENRENLLKSSESKFRSLVEEINDWVWEIDENGAYTYVSPIVERILGYRPDELLGKTPFDLMEEVEAERVRKLFDQYFMSKSAFKGIANTNLHKNGQKVILETSGQAIINEGGVFKGYRGVDRDITEKQHAAHERKQLEGKLHRAQKMEAIGLMAGGVAHDLNNILTGITGYPELLLLKLPEESDLRKTIEAIKESGERAAAVVDDLLTVARGVASTKVVTNLNTLVTEYLESPECRQLHSLYQSIQFRKVLAEDLPNISCSPIHIKKCIMNLVTNAAEAIDKSGNITLNTASVFPDSQCIKDKGLEQKEYVVLTVTDTGAGIPKENIEHIFEPFYTKKIMGRSGTGLGLAVVWNSVEDHEGKTFVKSSEKGTRFQLYFPVNKGGDIVQTEQKEKEGFSGNSEHILVVDDEPQALDIASQMLLSLGYRVDSVCSGELAIKFVKDNSVDLVVIDMLMEPNINGRQTYEEILKLYPKQKAIIASGFSESNDVKAALLLGAGAFIKKPYSMDQLGQAVKEALNN